MPARILDAPLLSQGKKELNNSITYFEKVTHLLQEEARDLNHPVFHFLL